jgi:hypothetical protein
MIAARSSEPRRSKLLQHDSIDQLIEPVGVATGVRDRMKSRYAA